MPQRPNYHDHQPNDDGAPASPAETEMLLAAIGAAAIVACLVVAVALKAIIR